MAEYKIAVIPGDGVGPEVTEEGLKALRAVAGRHGIGWDFELLPWGSDYYLKHGRMMPSDALDTLAGFDAIYLGAVGHPDLQDHVTLNRAAAPHQAGLRPVRVRASQRSLPGHRLTAPGQEGMGHRHGGCAGKHRG